MKIYTSYYWKFQNGKLPVDLVPVAVSNSQPAGLALPVLAEVVPHWQTVKRYKNATKTTAEESAKAEDDYTKEYFLTRLDNTTPAAVIRHIEKITGGKDAVLLCYEGSGKFCHRHILAKWLSVGGREVKEV